MRSLAPHPGWALPAVALVALLAGAAGFAGAWLVVSARDLVASPAGQAAPARAGTPAHAPATSPAPSAWDLPWETLARQPASPALLRERETRLETLARTDSSAALALAAAEPNWLARDRLRAAALRGWAAVAPAAATAWSLAQPVPGERLKCVEAALAGAVAQPAAALQAGLHACTVDPELAGAYGHALVNALVDRAGDFGAALEFASAATMVDRQSYLLDSAFYQWAQHAPDAAFAQVATLTEPAARAAALKGVIEGWADSDPSHLARYAQALPDSADRRQALAIALPRWAEQDPVAALAWMGQVDPHPDLDSGMAALASQPALIASRPTVALELTEDICDPARRTLVRSNVFFQWALQDPAAARRYAEAVPQPELRAEFLQDLASVPIPVAASPSATASPPASGP